MIDVKNFGVILARAVSVIRKDGDKPTVHLVSRYLYCQQQKKLDIAIKALSAINNQGFWSRNLAPEFYVKALDEYKKTANEAIEKIAIMEPEK